MIEMKVECKYLILKIYEGMNLRHEALSHFVKSAGKASQIISPCILKTEFYFLTYSYVPIMNCLS